MACRGVHFAITHHEAQRLLTTQNDLELLEIIQEEIEQRWDETWLVETDKAWDAIHRCLFRGTLDGTDESVPLRLAILGGRQLYRGSDYIIALVTPDEVREVARAIAVFDEAWFREKYDAFNEDDYGYPKSSEDFEYTWDYFQSLPPFFKRAGDAGRYVIFTVDQ